jgi:hypothetical protein
MIIHSGFEQKSHYFGHDSASIPPFLALLGVLPEFRARIRIFSPRCTLYALQKRYESGRNMVSYPCRGGMDFFFIDAKEGDTYPCGYRGDENLGKYWSMDGHGVGEEEPCFRCDRECFRGPSDLFGPLVEGDTNQVAYAAFYVLLRCIWLFGMVHN